MLFTLQLPARAGFSTELKWDSTDLGAVRGPQREQCVVGRVVLVIECGEEVLMLCNCHSQEMTNLFLLDQQGYFLRVNLVLTWWQSVQIIPTLSSNAWSAHDCTPDVSRPHPLTAGHTQLSSHCLTCCCHPHIIFPMICLFHAVQALFFSFCDTSLS